MATPTIPSLFLIRKHQVSVLPVDNLEHICLQGGSATGFREDGSYLSCAVMSTIEEARVLAAAYDTLAALEELVEVAEQRGYHPDWLINAHAAIAKARGAV